MVSNLNSPSKAISSTRKLAQDHLPCSPISPNIVIFCEHMPIVPLYPLLYNPPKMDTHVKNPKDHNRTKPAKGQRLSRNFDIPGERGYATANQLPGQGLQPKGASLEGPRFPNPTHYPHCFGNPLLDIRFYLPHPQHRRARPPSGQTSLPEARREPPYKR